MNKEWLVDELDEVLYASDPETYELIYINPAGIKKMGLEDVDYKGRKCYEIIQGTNSPCESCTRGLLYDQSYIWEYTNEHLNKHFIIKDKLIKYNDRPTLMKMAIDVTDKENTSRNLKNRFEIENTIVKCIADLISAKSLKEAMDLVLKSIAMFYKSDRAYVIEIDFEKGLASNTFEWCRDGVNSQMELLKDVDVHDISRWVDSAYNNEPIFIKDIEDIKVSNLNEYNLLRLQNIKRLYATPFNIQNSLGGYIGIDNSTNHLGDTSLIDSLAYFVINEITKRRMDEKLDFMIYHDALTGLPNRNSYIKYLDNAEKNKPLSLGAIVLDINGLKSINQEYGHRYGDFTIKSMVEIIKHHYNENNIFRISGDEFIVLCENMTREEFVSKIQLAKKDLSKMRNNGVALGYSWSNADVYVATLVQHADELMYIEKQTYYRNSDETVKHHNPEDLKELFKSFEENMFKVYLQPKANICTGEIVGAEALVRFEHPEYGIIPPSKFIHILEKEKTIKYLDLFIYEEVLKMLYNWREKGYGLIPISLNFSRITMLSEDLINTLLLINNKYNIPHGLIEIEITETIGEMERETIMEIGSNIKKQGFTISLDDFGHKYTNMSMLTFMKLDVLKLDRSIVKDIVSSKNSFIVVKYVLEMCREMGIRCVAEGVENIQQLSLLKDLKCDLAQGYLFSKPIPLRNFEEKYLI